MSSNGRGGGRRGRGQHRGRGRGKSSSRGKPSHNQSNWRKPRDRDDRFVSHEQDINNLRYRNWRGGSGSTKAGNVLIEEWRAACTTAVQTKDNSECIAHLKKLLQFDFPIAGIASEVTETVVLSLMMAMMQDIVDFLVKMCSRAAPMGHPDCVTTFCNLVATVVHRQKVLQTLCRHVYLT